METSQSRLSAEKAGNAYESGFNRGDNHRQRCGSVIPTTSSKEIRESIAEGKGSQKKSKERSNSFVRRARKTLPNLFSTIRRQSSAKMKPEASEGCKKIAAEKKVQSESRILDAKITCASIDEKGTSSKPCKDFRKTNEISFTTTKPSFDEADAAMGSKEVGLSDVDSQAINFCSSKTSLKLGSPLKKRNHKASFQLPLPIAHHAQYEYPNSPVNKSRRATSFSCAEPINEIFEHRKKRWSFLNRFFSDKTKVKRSASTKSKSSDTQKSTSHSPAEFQLPFRSNTLSRRSNSPTEIAVISAAHTLINFHNPNSEGSSGNLRRLSSCSGHRKTNSSSPTPNFSRKNSASERKKMSGSKQNLPPIAVMDFDGSGQKVQGASEEQKAGGRSSAAKDAGASSGGQDGRKVVSTAAKIKRGSFRMSKRWNQHRLPSDDVTSSIASQVPVSSNAAEVTAKNSRNNNSSNNGTKTATAPVTVTSVLIPSATTTGELAPSSEIQHVPHISSSFEIASESTQARPRKQIDRTNSTNEFFSKFNKNVVKKDSLQPPEQYFNMNKTRKCNSFTNFSSNAPSSDSTIFFHRANSMEKRPSDSIVVSNSPQVTKEKSAFEKLTNDLKRSFSKRGKSPTRNSVESSTSSMCSPTSAPEKSGLTFYIDAEASLKEDELTANQKNDSVWALTASSSVKRKSFRKPSRLDRSVHEKRFTSSVRDCSRRNASNKNISTRHSALVVASPIKEPSAESVKPKNSKEKIRFIISTLLDTERSYVSSLHYLVWVSLKPLQNRTEICEEHLLHYMLFKFPQILALHRQLLERIETLNNELESPSSDKPETPTIGRALLDFFSRAELRQVYSEFICKFSRTMEAKAICMGKTSFQKYIEVCQRQHQVKLSLDDLMIKPVQRIPRYLLLIKDLLGEYSNDNTDRQNLIEAQDLIRSLAALMNNQGSAELYDMPTNESLLQELEHVVDGLNSFLKSHDRRLIRHDFVTEMKNMLVKKNRILLLFNDAVMCLASKTKRLSSRRSSSFSTVSGIDPFMRYRVCWKCLIRDCDIVQSPTVRQDKQAIQKFEQDLNKLNEIISMADSLYIPHDGLVAQARKTHSDISKQLNELRTFYSLDASSSRIQIIIDTPAGIETVIAVFQNSLVRSQWENVFAELKMKAGPGGQVVVPEFIKSIPLAFDADLDDVRDQFKVVTGNDGQLVFIVASYDTYSIIVQLQNIQQNTPVLNRVYYTDGIINDAVIVSQRYQQDRSDLGECLEATSGFIKNSSRSHIALCGLVSPPPQTSSNATMGRSLAESQSWCGDTDKIGSSKQDSNVLQLPSQLNPRISVRSFDSDSSEGEDFISYEHYSPRHRRLARESQLSRRRNMQKPSQVNTNADDATTAAANSEKPSTSSGVTQHQQQESFFNSSRYHYTRNVTSSSAYSTEESTDIADYSFEESFNHSFSGSSIEEEAPMTMNWFLYVCTADGKIKTLGAIEDGEYFNLEEASVFCVGDSATRSTTSSENPAKGSQEDRGNVSITCLTGGASRIYCGLSDGQIMSFEQNPGGSLSLLDSRFVSADKVKCLLVCGDKLVVASVDNIIIVSVHNLLEMKRLQVKESVASGGSGATAATGNCVHISSVIRRNNYLIVTCDNTPSIHLLNTFDFCPVATINLSNVQLEDDSFTLDEENISVTVCATYGDQLIAGTHGGLIFQINLPNSSNKSNLAVTLNSSLNITVLPVRHMGPVKFIHPFSYQSIIKRETGRAMITTSRSFRNTSSHSGSVSNFGKGSASSSFRRKTQPQREFSSVTVNKSYLLVIGRGIEDTLHSSSSNSAFNASSESGSDTIYNVLLFQ